jgi:hypothetical protein
VLPGAQKGINLNDGLSFGGEIVTDYRRIRSFCEDHVLDVWPKKLSLEVLAASGGLNIARPFKAMTYLTHTRQFA